MDELSVRNSLSRLGATGLVPAAALLHAMGLLVLLLAAIRWHLGVAGRRLGDSNRSRCRSSLIREPSPGLIPNHLYSHSEFFYTRWAPILERK